MKRVIIVIRKGSVTDVITDSGIDVTVYDFDNIEDGANVYENYLVTDYSEKIISELDSDVKELHSRT